jgi:hypothetical protein
MANEDQFRSCMIPMVAPVLLGPDPTWNWTSLLLSHGAVRKDQEVVNSRAQ